MGSTAAIQCKRRVEQCELGASEWWDLKWTKIQDGIRWDDERLTNAFSTTMSKEISLCAQNNMPKPESFIGRWECAGDKPVVVKVEDVKVDQETADAQVSDFTKIQHKEKIERLWNGGLEEKFSLWKEDLPKRDGETRFNAQVVPER